MMSIDFLFKGLLVGMIISAPIGPVGILCLKRTITYGAYQGVFSALGAAVADTFYGFIAAFGLTVLSDFFLAYLNWIRPAGALFVLILGIHTFFKHHLPLKNASRRNSAIGYFTSTFFLTLTNPITILVFFALFAALGLAEAQNELLSGIFLLSGVFIGAMVWWLVFAKGLSFFRHLIDEKVLFFTHKIVGVLLVGCSLLILFDWMFHDQLL